MKWKINAPEIVATNGAVVRLLFPSRRMLPHEAVGAAIPRPRKLKAASEIMALATFNVAFILITVLGFNLFGDGIRDVLDPKMKQ